MDASLLPLLDQLIQEMTNAMQALADPLKGLNDDALLPLQRQTRDAIEADFERISQRLDKERAVFRHARALHQTVQDLIDDGYPDPITRPVSRDVLAELDIHTRVQQAARGTFTEMPSASSVRGVVGPERPTRKE
jgi:hypothetical protein